MIAVDASVLAYAVNRYVPEHPRAAAVLEDLVNGDAPWALPTSVIHEFVAFVTHAHAAVRPLEPGDAAAFIERVIASPSVRVLAATPRHAVMLVELLGTLEAIGGLPPGLETAVLLREHGVRELLSADRAMRRYPFLTVIDPLHGPRWSPSTPPERRYRVLKSRGID